MLTKGLDEDQKKRTDTGAMIEKLIGGNDYEQRMKERDKIMSQEQNIDAFQFEAATEEIMDDYIVKPYASIEEI